MTLNTDPEDIVILGAPPTGVERPARLRSADHSTARVAALRLVSSAEQVDAPPSTHTEPVAAPGSMDSDYARPQPTHPSVTANSLTARPHQWTDKRSVNLRASSRRRTMQRIRWLPWSLAVGGSGVWLVWLAAIAVDVPSTLGVVAVSSVLACAVLLALAQLLGQDWKR